MAEEGQKVTLNVYDLSQGLARQLSASFLGKVIEGIWHTGVVVYGNEYFFGGGIQQCPAGTTPYGKPLKVFELGTTHIPKDVFDGYLDEIRPRYTAETYNLLRHNCNNFSNEIAQFLVGASVPEYILNLPNEVLNSPMGPLIMPMIQNLETTLRAGAVPNAPQFKPNPTSLSSPVPETVSKTANACSDGKTASSTTTGTDKNAPSDHQKVEAPAVEPSGGGPEKKVEGDPLGNARNQIQDEITKEFAALMATGTLPASEAAAMATRKVMERYGNTGVALSQS